MAGEITTREYIEYLAREWGAFRDYSGFVLPGNSGKIGPEKIEEALNKVKGNSSGAYKGIVKSFSSNFGNMQGMFEISGPNTGYRVPENLTHGQKIIGHGVEWLIKFDRSFVILPVENRHYSVSKNPEKTLTRWSELSRQANIKADGKEWNPIQEYKPPTQPTSVADDKEVIFKMFSKPIDVKPQKEMPVATVTPIDFSAGNRPSAVAVLNNTIIQQQQVPVYIPVPVPGPVQYVPANVYESARTMRFMEFVKKLS